MLSEKRDVDQADLAGRQGQKDRDIKDTKDEQATATNRLVNGGP